MQIVLFEDEGVEGLWPANLTPATMMLRSGTVSLLQLASALG